MITLSNGENVYTSQKTGTTVQKANGGEIIGLPKKASFYGCELADTVELKLVNFGEKSSMNKLGFTQALLVDTKGVNDTPRLFMFDKSKGNTPWLMRSGFTKQGNVETLNWLRNIIKSAKKIGLDAAKIKHLIP